MAPVVGSESLISFDWALTTFTAFLAPGLTLRSS
jgi:hypothetical protein